jgi:hypothetical protein
MVAAVVAAGAVGSAAGLDQLLATTQREPDTAVVERPGDRLTLTEGDCPARPPGDEPVAVTSAVLTQCPRLLADRPVTYRGEAVRGIIDQGRHAWLQVNDGPYALDRGPLPASRTTAGTNAGVAVRIPSARAGSIDTVGDARHHGAIIEVTGPWQVSNAGDAGGAAIRAERVDVIQAGHGLDPPRSPLRTWAAVAAAGLALTLTGAAWWRRR